MLKLLAILAVLFVPGLMANIQSMVPLPDGRIVGGSPADIRQYPHQISMRYNGRHRCGGSIYTSNIIISAAHCVVGDLDASKLSIVAGSTNLSEVTWELPVSKYIIHENYKTSNNDNDVTILLLKGHFPFNEFIQPIALANSRPEAGAEVTVTGWGTLIEGGSSSEQLQEVNVNYMENKGCQKSYPFMITDSMLCAKVSGGGKDACQGDSGGPLIYNNKLLGVVSWGIGCARKQFPGVYAAMPQLYEWIAKTAEANTIEYAYL